MSSPTPLTRDYRPRFPPGYRPGIGIIGCGAIVREAHLPAYEKYGVDVVGVYDVAPEAARSLAEDFAVGQVFGELDDLLADPEIEVVDIATRPPDRVPLIRAALEAGKHVLAQKPLALDVTSAREVVELADRLGLKLAVNQNGRWAPPWRVATLLLEDGVIGDVVAVTHLYDSSFRFLVGTHFDQMEHCVLYDYSVHWLDITRCWLESKEVVGVRARDYRTPNQPPEGKTPWGAWVEVEYADGTSALIRAVGGSATSRVAKHFWIHGEEDVIRGSVLAGSSVELERDRVFTRFDLEGEWYPDGFAGTMGELLCAVAEEREPFNSARHNLTSLQMTLAACRSASEGSRPVALDEVA